MKLGIVTCLFVMAAPFAAACGSSTSSSSVSAIAVSPSPCAVGRTDSQQMSAVATLPDGTKQTITTSPGVTWSTGNQNTATVDAQGIVVGVNAGVTSVTAAYEGATGSVDCTVGP
jgi:S1-C subfamily serine protease